MGMSSSLRTLTSLLWTWLRSCWMVLVRAGLAKSSSLTMGMTPAAATQSDSKLPVATLLVGKQCLKARSCCDMDCQQAVIGQWSSQAVKTGMAFNKFDVICKELCKDDSESF